ncbi:MAG: DUF6440 family protein [Traorella sp.]
MKKENRFIITEIYSEDLHAVDKVLVDTQTRVQYLLHQEGTSCAFVCLVDETGLPLLSDTLTPLKPKTEKTFEDKPIQERPHDEILETFPKIEVDKHE